jgi:hypothetical protein
MGDYVMDRRPGLVAAAASRWWMFLLMGIAALVLGVILLLDLVVAVETLALLVAVGLIFSGLGEWFGSVRYDGPLGVVAGVLLVAAGVVALFWPGITLWALAVVTGAGLVMSGCVRIAAALMDKPDAWGWLLVGGVLAVGVGVLAVMWPAATVLVLAILLGAHLLVWGAVEIASAVALRELR